MIHWNQKSLMNQIKVAIHSAYTFMDTMGYDVSRYQDDIRSNMNDFYISKEKLPPDL